MEEVDIVTTRQVSNHISHELQDFIIEKKLVGIKEWKEIVKGLEQYVQMEEEMELNDVKREEMLVSIRESIREDVRDEIEGKSADNGKLFIQVFKVFCLWQRGTYSEKLYSKKGWK
ncbi:hypothetical protein NGRA_0862 [Nosema granulosis]|uniref:Uncharacterized protein n=1 Tax=Nosema granulosis TaxID=83296 RepID=A0A9P6KZX8_9MICR|nr:hypothetical protein NGRA_0862 [Nosema granulosis]